MTDPIPLNTPVLAGNEASYLQECVDTGFVSSVGPFVDRFESAFANYLGSTHAVACASGTAALHIALLVLGTGPGDLVPVSDLTFIASANAIRYTGADVLLVDSERMTWNLDTEQLHDAVLARVEKGEAPPRVVEAVHVLGHPAQMEPLLALRERFGTRIVEDAAESFGATTSAISGESAVGTLGDIGCFSFNGNKIITTGGGGMIVSDDAELAARARHLTTQAKIPGRSYVHDHIGFNYRMTNVAAAIGLAQLEQLPRFLAARRAIFARYDAALTGLPEVTLPPDLPWAHRSCWLYSLLLPTQAIRNEVLDELDRHGVQARPLWMPVSQQVPYGHAATLGQGVAADIAQRGLSLPSSVNLPPLDQDRIAAVVTNVLKSRAKTS